MYINQKKVLIITDIDFWVSGSGHRARLSSLVKYLAMRFNVKIAFVGPQDPYIKVEVERNFIVDFVILKAKGNLDAPKYGQRINEAFDGESFEAIIVEYLHNTGILKYVNLPYIKLFLDAHDIISERSRSFTEFGYQPWGYQLSEDQEIKILNIYDYILVLSKKDKQKLKALGIKSHVLVIPHPGTPINLISNSNGSRIGFVGSEYTPNVDAINYFLDKIWPIVLDSCDTTLFIFGNVCRQIDVTALRNVQLVGRVEDEKDIYKSVDVIINPVRFGAGLKIKNIEALSYGMPLITTTHGARGLERGINQAFLVTDDPGTFAAEAVSLIKSSALRKAFAKKAIRFIQKHYSPKHCYDALCQAIEQ